MAGEPVIRAPPASRLCYLLDTNAASEAMRGTPAIDTRLLALPADAWCISAVTRAELRYGVALRPDSARLGRLVEGFLAASTTQPWDAAAADAYGALSAALRRAGTPIGDFDTMIAAHALALDLTVVTDNQRHFERVPGLQVENWLRSGK